MLSTARPCSASWLCVRQCRYCSRLHHLFLYSCSDHWQAVCNDKILPHSKNTTTLPSDGTSIYLWMKRIVADWTTAVFLKQKEMLLSLVPPINPSEEEEVWLISKHKRYRWCLLTLYYQSIFWCRTSFWCNIGYVVNMQYVTCWINCTSRSSFKSLYFYLITFLFASLLFYLCFSQHKCFILSERETSAKALPYDCVSPFKRSRSYALR